MTLPGSQAEGEDEEFNNSSRYKSTRRHPCLHEKLISVLTGHKTIFVQIKMNQGDFVVPPPILVANFHNLTIRQIYLIHLSLTLQEQFLFSSTVVISSL